MVTYPATTTLDKLIMFACDQPTHHTSRNVILGHDWPASSHRNMPHTVKSCQLLQIQARQHPLHTEHQEPQSFKPGVGSCLCSPRCKFKKAVSLRASHHDTSHPDPLCVTIQAVSHLSRCSHVSRSSCAVCIGCTYAAR